MIILLIFFFSFRWIVHNELETSFELLRYYEQQGIIVVESSLRC